MLTKRTVLDKPTWNPEGRELAVRVESVSKQYSATRPATDSGRGSGRRWALQDVSFTVARGEMVGLLGPNGAGKTSLLKSIATLLEVNSGRITVEGIDVAERPIEARRLMGLVTCDERSFYWRLSARANLKFFGALYRVPRQVLSERIDELLEALDLTDSADRPYHSFSTGMRQKMAVARGLLTDPRLVLYDEPMRSLDPVSRERIRHWIRSSRQRDGRKTHIIATNQLDEAEQLCDRVLILNGGRIVAQGSVREIRNRFGEEGQLVHRITCTGFAPYLLLEPAPDQGLWAVTLEPGDAQALVVRAATSRQSEGLSLVLDWILQAGGRVLKCETEQASFDEVFCRIIREGCETGAPATVEERC
jgi:ABC-2 type transport system ATP-binding protein